MVDVTNESLIKELLKLDARAERMVETMEELLAYSRETNRLVAEWRQEEMHVESAVASRQLNGADATT